MLARYFRRPSRIEQLRSNTGGYLLEGFAKELSQDRYQWLAARKHIRTAEHFLHWMAHRIPLQDVLPGVWQVVQTSLRRYWPLCIIILVIT
jgi:hypothetical protein